MGRVSNVEQYYAQRPARKRCGQDRGGARHSQQVRALRARARPRVRTSRRMHSQHVPPPRAAAQEDEEQGLRRPAGHHNLITKKAAREWQPPLSGFKVAVSWRRARTHTRTRPHPLLHTVLARQVCTTACRPSIARRCGPGRRARRAAPPRLRAHPQRHPSGGQAAGAPALPCPRSHARVHVHNARAC